MTIDGSESAPGIRLERDLLQSQAFLQSTLDALHSSIAILDPSGRILAVNLSWRQFADQNDLGGTDYAVGRNYLQVCDTASGAFSQEAPVAAHFIREIIAGRRDQAYLEYPCHSRSEQRWYAMHASRFKVEDSIRVVLSHENITGRKKAEEESLIRHSQLAHIARLNMMGQLASGLAHELSHPLSTILCGAELLLRTLRSQHTDDETTQVLNEIAGEAERAGQIIRRLRRFVSKREPRRSTLDMNALVRETIDLLAIELRDHGVNVHADTGDVGTIEADAVQLQQVLLNLMHNAIEAMDAPEIDHRHLTVRTLRPSAYAVEVSVSDTGKGLPSETLDRIFDSFFTTKPEGMGIGLSISRSIIETHGGRLWATQNTDRGMTFHFRLPMAGGGSDGS